MPENGAAAGAGRERPDQIMLVPGPLFLVNRGGVGGYLMACKGGGDGSMGFPYPIHTCVVTCKTNTPLVSQARPFFFLFICFVGIPTLAREGLGYIYRALLGG